MLSSTQGPGVRHSKSRGSALRLSRGEAEGSLRFGPVRGVLVVLLIGQALTLSLGATGAGAIATKIRGHGYGVTPIRGVNTARLPGTRRAPRSVGPSRPSGSRNQDGLPFGGGPLESEGGPVMHTANTHVIYWDPGEEFTVTTKGIVGAFFADVAHDSGLATNVFGVAGQYIDETGNAAYASTFGGALADTQAYPTTGNCTVPNEEDKGPYAKCLFDSQLQTELSRFINEKKLPKGPTQLYFLLLPHSVATCLPDEEVEVEEGVFETVHPCSNNTFCAYHSYINPGSASEIIYADIPFSLLDTGFAKGCQDDNHSGIQQPNPDNAGGKDTETRFADVALKYISHEYIEATTDPLVNFETAWVDENGLEIGDKCNGFHGNGTGVGYDKNAFVPTLGGGAVSNDLFNQSINEGHFYLQSEWDNAGAACLMKPLALSSAAFTPSPASQAEGKPVQFAASVVDPYGQPAYAWSFGDGGTATVPSPIHIYAVPGEYTVEMTAKDALTGSTTAPVQHTVTVTARGAPAVVTRTASSPGENSATLNGSVNPNGDLVSNCYFDFGTTAAYGSSAPCGSNPGEGGGAVAVSAALGGLTPNTTYHFRIVASNSFGTREGTDNSFTTAQTPSEPPPATSQGSTASATTTSQPVSLLTSALIQSPNSAFNPLHATFNPKTGVITLTGAVGDPGTFSWLLRFQNGKFGVFAASSAKCKKGFVRLKGKCRHSTIAFARGSKTVPGPGTVTFTAKPSASALKALKNALKQKKGLPVSIRLTFQSSRGGSAVAHTQSLTVRLKTK
jgi:hypothetical protein